VEDAQTQVRRQALPSDGDSVVQSFLEAHPSFPYREHFAQLLVEAHRAFLAGCPRASIIVAGEALLRAIYDGIVQHIRVGNTITISRGRRQVLLAADSAADLLFGLADDVSFCQAIDALKEAQAYSDDLIHQMFVVKDLRNNAAHGEFPILDEWDPDDPRPPEQIEELRWNPDFEFPEGYRFIPSKQRSEWFTLDLRNYNCNSLKPLAIEDRFAAIQYLLVLTALARMRRTEKGTS
jgi:hypothetical protein